MFQSRSAPRRHKSNTAASPLSPRKQGNHFSSSASAPLPTNTTPVNGFSSRIPTTLQHVFLSSNRGHDVDKPPPLQVANRAFRTLWSKTFHGKKSQNNGNSNGNFKSDDKELKLEKLAQVVTAVAVEKVAEEPEEQSPQDYLDALLLQRGYPTTRYETLKTAFYYKPTALQQASYSRYLIDVIKANDVKKFQACMLSGLSVNPCNTFGESLLHMVCRRGDAALLHVMLDAGTDLHVSDDYGRTPLHDACWAPQLAADVLSLILKHDPANVNMFYMQDARGSLPLSYVRKEAWADWILFLDRDKDVYWPIMLDEDTGANGIDKASTLSALPLLQQGPHTRVARHPHNALTLELATMVANGRLAPEEAAMIKAEVELESSRPGTSAANGGDDGTVEESYSNDDEEDSDDYSDSDDDSYSSDYDDESDDEEDELLLEGLQGMLQQPKQ